MKKLIFLFSLFVLLCRVKCGSISSSSSLTAYNDNYILESVYGPFTISYSMQSTNYQSFSVYVVDSDNLRLLQSGSSYFSYEVSASYTSYYSPYVNDVYVSG